MLPLLLDECPDKMCTPTARPRALASQATNTPDRLAGQAPQQSQVHVSDLLNKRQVSACNNPVMRMSPDCLCLSAAFVPLTAETFMESMLDLLGDERQSFAGHLHPLILLLDAIATGNYMLHIACIVCLSKRLCYAVSVTQRTQCTVFLSDRLTV